MMIILLWKDFLICVFFIFIYTLFIKINNCQFMSGKILWSGAMMEKVEDMGNGEVKKTPRAPGITTIEAERTSLIIHQEIQGILVPDWEIQEVTWWFTYHQEMVKWSAVNLLTDITREELITIIEASTYMQNERGLLLDLFGMQWLMNLFKYYEKGTALWKFTDAFSDINAGYLETRHNLPKSDFHKMLADENDKFIAHNLLRNEEWKLVIVDTDNRPLNPLSYIPRLNPMLYIFNKQWQRMTNIALEKLLELHDKKNS